MSETFPVEAVAPDIKPSSAQMQEAADSLLLRRNERLRLLSEALAYLLSARDPEQVVKELLPKVAQHLGTDTYFNFMVTPRRDALFLHACGGIPEEVQRAIARLEFGQAICGCVAQTREPMHVTDIQNHGDPRANLVRSFGIQAYACNPLLAGDKILGTLSFASRSKREFAEDELEFARTISQYVALALERAMGEEALRKQTRSLEVINEVGSVLAGELDLDKLLQSVTDAGREVTGAAYGAFFYNGKDESGEKYSLFTLSGAPREAFKHFPMPRNTPLFHETFYGTASVRIGDVLQDARYGKMGPHHGLPPGHLSVRSYLAVPVISRSSQVWGGLLFGHPEPHVFTEEGERILIGIAAQAAIAIDNANLYQKLQRELEHGKKTEEELRLAQSKLQGHAEELEKKVGERTASLSEAVAQMEEFSYSVSHDLRAPLRAMQAYAQALLEDHGDKFQGEAGEYLARISRNSERMEQLTHDMLQYSRLGRGEIQLIPINLEKLFHEICSHYAEFRPEKARIRLEKPLLGVLGHETSLAQCLSNLMINSVKFVRPGVFPELAISTRNREGWIRIGIQDNGIGIKPEHHKKLFRLFERLSETRDYEGTGIGLAMVRKAVEKMNGRYGVDSDGCNGSCFWIELPQAKN